MAREQDAVFGSGSADEPARQTQLVQALHLLCQIPAPAIATMLDRDIAYVRAALATDRHHSGAG